MTEDRTREVAATRRSVLVGAASLAAGTGLVTVLRPQPARATPASMQAAIRQVVRGATVRKGKVTLDVPPIVENGNTVSLDVAVESPMTLNDHVKAIHVF